MRREGELFWRLVYDGGTLIEEPADGGSIVEAWSGADELQIVAGQTVVHTVELEIGRYRPIFYRIRSQAVQMNRSQPGILAVGGGVPPVRVGGTRLAAVVFGRGVELEPDVDLERLEGTQAVNVTLWAVIDGRVIDCPKAAFDLAQVQRQLAAPLSERKILVV